MASRPCHGLPSRVLARDLPETAPHATSRPHTTPPSAARLTLVDGLEVFAVDTPQEAKLLVLHTPPQAEELKPFLVHGAIVGDKVEGAFVSIVRRREEYSVPITASAVHAMIAAGRALLRRGELPDPVQQNDHASNANSRKP
jgi:hypothetical protein